MRATVDWDIIVIGGGVIGLTVAVRALQHHSSVRVLLLERATVGSGATGYAGAIDIPYHQTEFHRSLVASSWAWYEAHATASQHRLAVPISWYFDAPNDEFELRQRLSGTFSRDCERDTARAWKHPGAQETFLGDSYVLRPLPWCQDLLRQVRASGRGHVLENTAARSIETRFSSVHVLASDGLRVSASHVIVCTGPWFPKWLQPLATLAREKVVRNKRVFGLLLEVDERFREWRAIGFPSGGIFLLPHGQTGLYSMSIRHDEWDVDPDSDLIQFNPEVMTRADTFLNQTIGDGNWRISKTRVFMDTYNNEFVPVVQSLGEFNNRVTVVTGTHGSGVRLAPGLAEVAVRSCFGE